MRFYCGPSPKEQNEVIAGKLREWHRWFAFLPINIGNDQCAWLEFVERRYPNAEAMRGSGALWKGNAEYRACQRRG
jgi:hypothetical protein